MKAIRRFAPTRTSFFSFSRRALASRSEQELLDLYRPVDTDIEEFIRRNPPHSTLATTCYDVLAMFMPQIEAAALLGMKEMQVLNADGVRTVLDSPDQEWGSLLDIGAGAGGTTAQMQTLFREVTAVEASRLNCWRMKKRGIHQVFHAIDLEDIIRQDKQYDVVSLMNVLDRCTHPRRLLEQAISRAKPNGKMILAFTHPFECFVPNGLDTDEAPEAPLHKNFKPCPHWENTLAEFVENVLDPHDLVVETVTRVPYLCQSCERDGKDYHRLDNAVVVCRKEV